MGFLGLNEQVLQKTLSLAVPRNIQITGDAAWTTAFDGSADVSAALALSTQSGLTAGNYGDASHVPVITVDDKGRITAVSTAPVSIATMAWSAVTGTPTTVFGYGITDAVTHPEMSSTLASYAPLTSPAFAGIPTAPTPTTGDNDTSIATTAFVQSQIAASVSGTATAVGHQSFPSGAVMQWGAGSTDALGQLAVTFDIAFPTAVFSITSSVATGNYTVSYGTPTTTGTTLTVVSAVDGTAAPAGVNLSWQAFGH